MRIQSLKVSNLRTLDTFSMSFPAGTTLLIGENGIGKTSVLHALSLALGNDRRIRRTDFRDLEQPIEIVVVLGSLTEQEKAELLSGVDFSSPATLTIGVRATWDAAAEEVEQEHGYPSKNWTKSKPDERAALPVWTFPATRDVGQMLAFGQRRNVMQSVLESLDISTTLEQVQEQVTQAQVELTSTPEIAELLENTRGRVRKVLGDASGAELYVGPVATSAREILGQLQLYAGAPDRLVPLRDNSSGAVQAAGFAFLLHLVELRPHSIVLVDEPELSFHPQAQRALMRLINAVKAQFVISTHSSNLLDRADPRSVVRLHRVKGSTVTATPQNLSEPSVRKLMRFTNPQSAEAFFARRVILVEGISDKLALEVAAELMGLNLDTAGVTILALDGGGSIETFLKLLGKSGFRLDLCGLCDEDHRNKWIEALSVEGYGPIKDNEDLERIGFYVSTRDLEDELIRALGVTSVLSVVDKEGESAAWVKFAAQPANKARSTEDNLRDFIGHRDRKVRYAPILVEGIDAKKLPANLKGPLSHVK